MNAIRLASLLGLLSCAPTVVTANGSTLVLSPPTIEEVRGHLFDATTGTLSDANVLAPADKGRWNDTRSSAIFVVVRVAGKPLAVFDGKLGPAYKIRLVATDLTTSKRLTVSSTPITVLNERGAYFASFLVYIDRCSSVRIETSIQGRGATSRHEGVAAFACGE